MLSIQKDLFDELHSAAGFDTNTVYPSLFQLFGYRKRVAEQLLSIRDNENKKHILEVYTRVNLDIKLILGIK